LADGPSGGKGKIMGKGREGEGKEADGVPDTTDIQNMKGMKVKVTVRYMAH
jgi:hypothetical protein